MNSTSSYKDSIQIVPTGLYRDGNGLPFCQIKLCRVGVNKIVYSCARIPLRTSCIRQLFGHHSVGTWRSLKLDRPKVGPDTPSHPSMERAAYDMASARLSGWTKDLLRSTPAPLMTGSPGATTNISLFNLPCSRTANAFPCSMRCAFDPTLVFSRPLP